MKKFIFTMAVIMLATHLPAPTVVLTISALANGNLQIVATMGPTVKAYHCVLQSTSDFVIWTAISTNTFFSSGDVLTVTNIVQTTNSMNFYRAQLQ